MMKNLALRSSHVSSAVMVASPEGSTPSWGWGRLRGLLRLDASTARSAALREKAGTSSGAPAPAMAEAVAGKEDASGSGCGDVRPSATNWQRMGHFGFLMGG